MADVLVPLAEGFEEIEALTVVDVLRRGGQKVVTASLETFLQVSGAHGISVQADALLQDVVDGDYDAIVLPGGGGGTERMRKNIVLIRRLQRQAGEKRLICAICAAPAVLVEAGVLDSDVQVTCYPACQMELDRPWVPAPVVADGNVITGQAPGSAMLFALVVLKTLAGEAAAYDVAGQMVTDVLD